MLNNASTGLTLIPYPNYFASPMATISRTSPWALFAAACLAFTAGGPCDIKAQTPGTVLLNVRSAYLKDDQGNPFGQTDSKLVVFVADLDGDGVAAPTADSFAPGSDDFVFGSLGTTFDTGGTAVLGGINLFANTPLFPNGPTIETGDAFAMFWYPEFSSEDFLDLNPEEWAALRPGETVYGAYNTPDSVEDASWTIPNPPSAEDIMLFTTEVPGVGTLDPALLEARFIIPEPSSAILTLVSAGFLVLRRRRRSLPN